jgi:hypothetical protein
MFGPLRLTKQKLLKSLLRCCRYVFLITVTLKLNTKVSLLIFFMMILKTKSVLKEPKLDVGMVFSITLFEYDKGEQNEN